MDQNVSVLSIAIIHTLFNIISTVIIMPFCGWIEKISKKTIKGEKEKSDVFSTLDDRFLSIPSFAVEKCRTLVFDMFEITRHSLLEATSLLTKFDKAKAKNIVENEANIDKYEDKTSAYLVKIAGKELSANDSLEVTRLLHVVGDIERVSDHSVNILNVAREISEKGIVFSKEAAEDINIITSAVNEIINITIDAFINEDYDLAKKVEPLDAVIDKLKYKIKNNHINKLLLPKLKIYVQNMKKTIKKKLNLKKIY